MTTAPSSASDTGIVRGTRPSGSWVRVGRGLHRRADEEVLLADLRAWAAVLPSDACFTHVTALRARGLWLPRLPARAPVFASMSRDEDRLRRPEIRTLRHTSQVPCTTVGDVRVADAAEAALVSARDLSPLDLVMVLDGVLHLGAGHPGELWALARTRRWGAPALRRALPLVDGRSESPWETVLRLFHRCADIPVEPQVDLVDGRGRFVARADLLVCGRRWVHEYDGAGHRDGHVNAADLRRERALLAIGCVRRGFTAGDLTVRAAATMRELDDALDRPGDVRRLARWRRLLDSSTLTAGGVRRLAQRWHITPLSGQSGRGYEPRSPSQ